MSNWTIAFIVLAISFVLKQAGIVESIWTPLAFAGVIAAISIIQKKLTGSLAKWATAGVVCFLLIYFGPIVLQFAMSDMPYTAPEVEEQKRSGDLRLSEAIHPPGFRQMAALKETASRIEGVLGQEIYQELVNIETEYLRTGDFSRYQEQEKRVREKIRRNINWRESNQKFVTNNGGNSMLAAVGGDFNISAISNLEGKSFIWAVFGAFVLLIAIAIFFEKVRAIAILLIFVLIAGLMIDHVLSYYHDGGLQKEIEAKSRMIGLLDEIKKEKAKHPFPGQNSMPREGPAVQLKTYELDLDPKKWSEPIPYTRGYGIEPKITGPYVIKASTEEYIICENEKDELKLTYIKYDGTVYFPEVFRFERLSEVRWIKIRGVGKGSVRIFNSKQSKGGAQ